MEKEPNINPEQESFKEIPLEVIQTHIDPPKFAISFNSEQEGSLLTRVYNQAISEIFEQGDPKDHIHIKGATQAEPHKPGLHIWEFSRQLKEDIEATLPKIQQRAKELFEKA